MGMSTCLTSTFFLQLHIHLVLSLIIWSFRNLASSKTLNSESDCGHFRTSVSYTALYNPSTFELYGSFKRPCYLYKAKEVKLLKNVIKTPDIFCRLTSLDCPDAIHRFVSFHKEILCPVREMTYSRCSLWNHFLFFYKDGHEALSSLEWSIGRHSNHEKTSIQNILVVEFLSPFLKSSAEALIECLHEAGFCRRLMADLLPTLFIPNGASDVCLLETLFPERLLGGQRTLISIEVKNLYHAFWQILPVGSRRPLVFKQTALMALQDYY